MSVARLSATGKSFYSQEFLTANNNLAASFTSTTQPSGNVNDIEWGNGVFVAVGTSTNGATNQIQTSPDGITWTSRSLPSNLNRGLYSVAWGNTGGNGTFVALGDLGGTNSTQAFYSTDNGVTWTTSTLPTSITWASVEWHINQFVAVAGLGQASNAAATSPDGITWTSRTLPSSKAWSKLVSNGTYLVLIGGGNRTGTVSNTDFVYKSSDGINWGVNGAMPSTSSWCGLAWSPVLSKWYAVPNASGAAHGISSDGLTWTAVAAGVTATFVDVVWAGDRFFAISPAGTGTNNFYYAPGISAQAWAGPTIGQFRTLGTNVNSTTLASSLPTAVVVCSSGTAAAYSKVTPTTWTCPAGVYTVDVLAVAGGGAGGSAGTVSQQAGSGGGGQVIRQPISVVPGTTYSILLGAGGIPSGGTGVNGFNGHATLMYTGGTILFNAFGGGGGGGAATAAGCDGATGGGGASSGTSQSGGAGGGAGGPAGTPVATGVTTVSEGGRGGPGSPGGGGGFGLNSAGIGGAGGLGLYGYGGGAGGTSGKPGAGTSGGAHGQVSAGAGIAGAANTGGGGSGSNSTSQGGAGGSGYLRLDWWA